MASLSQDGVALDVDYQPRTNMNDSMPRYSRRILLSLDPISGALKEGDEGTVPPGLYWARWQGRLSEGNVICIQEDSDEIVLRWASTPIGMRFFYCFTPCLFPIP